MLPVKVERNIMRGALRAGMNQVKPEAQRNIHSVSGVLAAGLKVGTRKSGSNVIAYLARPAGTRSWRACSNSPAQLPHLIKPLTRKALAIGGVAFSSVQHPGFRPKPFMRPALDTRAEAAVVAAAEYMKQRLATKEGLDTADIVIGGGA
jgi:hypothetical protein